MTYRSLFAGLATLAHVLLFAACGLGGSDEGVRVRIEQPARDGAVPEPLYLVPARAEGLRDRIRMTRVDGSEGPLFFAEGAPKGHYTIINDAGWQLLHSGALPELHADSERNPSVVTMAKPQCLYLVPEIPRAWTLQALVHAHVRRPDQEAHWEQLDARPQGDGWIQVDVPAERFPPGTQIEVYGTFEGGLVAQPVAINVPEDPRRPYVRRMRAAESPPLTARVLPGPGRSVEGDPARVHVLPEGMPTFFERSAKLIGGEAVLLTVPRFAETLIVTVPVWGSAATWEVDGAVWRERQVTSLADAGPSPRRLPLVGLPKRAVPSVQCAASQDGVFARLPVVREGDEWVALVPSGSRRLLVAHDQAYARVELGSEATQIDVPELAKGVRLRGSVSPPLRGARVRAEIKDGSAWLQADGCEVGIGPTGMFTLYGPAGSYRLHVVLPGDRVVSTKVVPFEYRPGALISGTVLSGH